MYLQGITPNYNSVPQKSQQVNFQGINLDRMSEIIPDTKVSKNLRLIDIGLFRTYLASRKFRMNITAEDIKALEKYDGEEFIAKSYDFLIKKLGIHPDIAPGVFSAPIDGDTVMAYVPNNNIICINTNIGDMTKSQCFAYMRHEFQHYLQNISIFRHETIGERAVEEYTKEFVKTQKKVVESYLSMPDEELRKNENVNADIVIAIKRLTEAGDTEGLDKIYKNMADDYRVEIQKFRQTVIDKMGVIKADSEQTSKIQKCFEEFVNVGYYKQDRSIDYGKYFSARIEKEAIASQVMAQGEFEMKCPIAVQRAEFFRALKEDPDDMMKVIDEISSGASGN